MLDEGGAGMIYKPRTIQSLRGFLLFHGLKDVNKSRTKPILGYSLQQELFGMGAGLICNG